MNKSILRKMISHELSLLSTKKRKQVEAKLRENLFKSKAWKQSQSIGITMNSPLEWDTKEIIQAAWKDKKQVAIPKITNQMEFQRLDCFEELHKGKYDLFEIKHKENKVTQSQMDLLIVPGLAFNAKGYRLGFGKGFYDRYLKDFSQQTLALLYEEVQLLSDIPVEAHDVAVDILITDQREIDCL